MLNTFCKAGLDFAPKKVSVFNFLFAKQEAFANDGMEFTKNEAKDVKANERKDELDDIKKFDKTFGGDTAKIKQKLTNAMTAFARLVAKFDAKNPRYTKDEADLMKALIQSSNDASDKIDSKATQADSVRPWKFKNEANKFVFRELV